MDGDQALVGEAESVDHRDHALQEDMERIAGFALTDEDVADLHASSPAVWLQLGELVAGEAGKGPVAVGRLDEPLAGR